MEILAQGEMDEVVVLEVEVVEAVGWTEGGVEVVVLTEEVGVVVELLWVVTDMDHLQLSEVAWYHRVDQWPRGVDLKAHKVLMVILLILIHRANILVARLRHVE